MKIRATLLLCAKVGVIAAMAAGCGARPNKIMADTAVLPYQAPDISEITGIEEPDTDSEEAPEAPAPEPGK
ncbi:MAG TPA: hypothetical protein VL326_33170 [Kofleriaceae bacterium]|nr:hypothetical protein [Kofleriaceae bacterium]